MKRLAGVWLTYADLLALCQGRAVLDLPEGYEIVGIAQSEQDTSLDRLTLHISHPSFWDVPVGCAIPYLAPNETHIRYHETGALSNE